MRKIILPFLLCSLLVACSGGIGLDQRWSQFHSNAANQGALLVNTQNTLRPLWSIDLEPIIHSSPVLDEEGNIYIGATNGRLLKIDPDGVPLCSSNHVNETIVGSPSVGEDGNIYFITNKPLANDRFISTLRSVDANCNPRWSYEFSEEITGYPGNTTASPKTLTTLGNQYVVVPVNASKVCKTEDCNDVEDGLSELFIFNGDNGSILRRKTIGGCITLAGGGSDIGGFVGDIWDAITDFLGPGSVLQDPLYKIYGWIDPTIAVVNYSSVVEDINEPFLVVANQCLGLRLTCFKWTPFSVATIIREWTYEDTSHHYKYSSPGVFTNGLIVIGRDDGLVQAFDIYTGDKQWEYKAGEAVMATPSSLGRQIFIASLTTLHLLDYNGDLIRTFDLEGQTISSPSLSANHVHVSSTDGMYILSLDLLDSTKDSSSTGGLVTPAIGVDGRIYTVHYTDNHSVLRAYSAN